MAASCLVAGFVVSLLLAPAFMVPIGLLAAALTLVGAGVALHRDAQSRLIRLIAVVALLVGSAAAIGGLLALGTVSSSMESGAIEGPAVTAEQE